MIKNLIMLSEAEIMNRKLYISTGTMVGRKNGYNYTRALSEIGKFMDKGLCCGLELMMLEHYYDKADDVVDAVMMSGVPAPIIHCEKEIGTMLSDAAGCVAEGDSGTAEMLYFKVKELFRMNCSIGEKIGAERMVLHLWGGRKSDSHVEYNIENLPELISIAEGYGIRMLIENIPSNTWDPRSNWHKLLSRLGNGGLIFDTRFGKLHEQIFEILSDRELTDKIEHIHISDFAGTYRDFAGLRPILHPGEGSVNFDEVSALLDGFGYSGTITLESPVMEDESLNINKLENTLKFLNEKF